MPPPTPPEPPVAPLPPEAPPPPLPGEQVLTRTSMVSRQIVTSSIEQLATRTRPVSHSWGAHVQSFRTGW